MFFFPKVLIMTTTSKIFVFDTGKKSIIEKSEIYLTNSWVDDVSEQETFSAFLYVGPKR